MEELIKIKIQLNKIDPNIFLDPREVRIIEESNVQLSKEELNFIAASREYYNSALQNGDSVTLLKDHSLSLEYAKALEDAKDQLQLKNKELEENKKQLEDDLASEMNAKIKMKKTGFQVKITYLLLLVVAVFGLFPAVAEVIGHKLSPSTVSFTERTLLSIIPILAMIIMNEFNVKKYQSEGDGKFNIEKYDA